MGFLSGLTEAGASALSAGVGFLGNLGGSIAGGLFNANQAAKNRAFQERMYNRQYEDTIKFWNMQNEYNLPSAVYQREMEGLQQNGLNPLLMYGSGSPQGVSTAAPQLPSAPHGAQANAGSFNTRLDLANLALVEAQGDVLRSQAADYNASAELKNEQKYGQSIQNEVAFRTRDAKVALANGEVDKCNAEIEWLCTQDFALTNMTAANLDNIASIMSYREKYYNLDEARNINQIWYNIESIALGKMHVSNELKRIAVEMYNAETNRQRVQGELKVFAAQVGEINSRKDLNEAQKCDEYLKAYNQFIKNTMLDNIGTENLGGAAGLMLLLTGNMSGRIQ